MKMTKNLHRASRKARIRARVQGTAARPRLSVHRSLANVSAQVIDDTTGRTIAAASTSQLKAKGNVAGASKVGAAIAAKCKEAGITAIVFFRNAYKYHGCVRALAEAARENGLTF